VQAPQPVTDAAFTRMEFRAPASAQPPAGDFTMLEMQRPAAEASFTMMEMRAPNAADAGFTMMEMRAPSAATARAPGATRPFVVRVLLLLALLLIVIVVVLGVLLATGALRIG
jgi:hypothetical protein